MAVGPVPPQAALFGPLRARLGASLSLVSYNDGRAPLRAPPSSPRWNLSLVGYNDGHDDPVGRALRSANKAAVCRDRNMLRGLDRECGASCFGYLVVGASHGRRCRALEAPTGTVTVSPRPIFF